MMRTVYCVLSHFLHLWDGYFSSFLLLFSLSATYETLLFCTFCQKCQH